MSTSIAFIICTEPGRLEGQSLMLAESIRQFGGQLRDTPIYSFHPRNGDPVSINTRKAFETLNVTHQQLPINVEFNDYYLANKPFVCAYAEQMLEADIIVFIDSDKCFFSEPSEFLLPNTCDVRMRPEYGQGGIGSTGGQDPQDGYWQRLYEILGVQQEIFINTSIGNKRIRGYWNSGLVAVRRSAGIFTLWKENFEKIMHLKIEPTQGNYFVEQSVLSATLCSLEKEVSHFSNSYSYPLPLHNRISKDLQIESFDRIVSIHYFNMFFYKDWKRQIEGLKDIDKSSDKYQWLCERVTRYSMPYQPILHRQMLTVRNVEHKLRKFNINVNLSGLIERMAKF